MRASSDGHRCSAGWQAGRQAGVRQQATEQGNALSWNLSAVLEPSTIALSHARPPSDRSLAANVTGLLTAAPVLSYTPFRRLLKDTGWGRWLFSLVWRHCWDDRRLTHTPSSHGLATGRRS